MIYSPETLQVAFSAPSVRNLFRDFITVDDAIESQEYEAFKDSHHAAEEKKFMTMHQGDNMEDSNFDAGCQICGDPRGH